MGPEAYPVKSYENYPQKALDGHDIYRSATRWVAMVVVETERQRELRLYAWRKKGEEWKVDLASLNIGFWNLAQFAEKAEELRKKYEIRK